jgi:enoyl-CoA hydratase/carnithine racemase
MKRYETIIYEKDREGIATITMNRPEVRNAQNWLMVDERDEAVVDAMNDDSVRVLIVTGAGVAFCAGDDIKGMWLNTEGRAKRQLANRLEGVKGNKRLRYLQGFWKPTIAAVNGPAVGAGLEIALECDVRITSEGGKFGWFFVRRNLQSTNVPDGLMRMSHIMGLGRAMEFMLSGELMEAEEAVRTGMANKLVPQDKLMDEARAMAHKIMQGAPLAQMVIKQMVHTSMFDPTRLVDMSTALGGTLRQTEDHLEAARAFAEKRAANFKMR